MGKVWYNIISCLWGEFMKPIGSGILSTSRLILRPPQREDAEALVRIKSLPMKIEEAQKAVAGMLDELRKPFTFHWVITLEGEVIGRIKAWDVNPYDGYLQLGYDMGPEYRCKGYMSEAVQAVVRFMLTDAQANRVFCSVRAGNTASRRVCEKAGMVLEGTMRQHYAQQDGGYDDVCIYGIVKSDLEECP